MSMIQSKPPAGLPTVRIPEGSHLPDNRDWENRFEIPSSSSNNMYIIAQHKTKRYWGCSCPGWKRHRKCHHLESMALPCHCKPHEVRLTND